MELLLVVNGLRDVHQVTRNGREYLVAAATLIVPGVLSGSKGPLLYPEDEVSRNPSSWNDIPITYDHPTRNGRPISGRDPEVTVLGRLHRASYDGRLRAEAWFDVETCNAVDPRIVDSLRAGKSFGLSTGLHTQNIEAPLGSRWKDGRLYTHVARNYSPDHLAVLIDKRGACSLADGCGFLVNTGSGEADMVALESFTVNELGETMPDFLEELAGLVDNLRKAYPSGKLEMTPEKACKILEDGSVNGTALTKRQRGMFGALCGQRPTNNDNPDSPILGAKTMNPELRAKIIGDLVSNCGCSYIPADAPWKGMTAQQLNNLSDTELSSMDTARKFIANNTPREGFTDGFGNRHEYDRAAGQWKTTPAARTTPVPASITNAAPTGGQPGNGQPINNGQPLTPEQFLGMMPKELQPIWNSAVEIHNRERNAIIDQLVSNTAEVDRADVANALATKNIDELRLLLKLMPQRPAYQQQQQQQQVTNYFGQHAGQYSGANNGVVTEPPLPMPKYEFTPPARPGRKVG